ncbi:MAG: heat-inducible transcriptional repressor HrcA [Chlamydiae bacterium]|nr:heat-inducible transcriptional repressor HrcA [Chlamydiota bacterium]
MLRPIQSKKPSKEKREKQVLLGLVELYLKMGSPIGSNTLRENGFESLSSATIRNYFSKLEKTGFLKQQHSSGGRVPTQLAYKFYADSHLPHASTQEKDKDFFRSRLEPENREPAAFLQKAAELVSELTGCAVFLSSPRFDQDFILDIKLLAIDPERYLCVLITDFGLVHTEILFADKNMGNFNVKRIETYLHSRISGLNKPQLSKEEETIANHFYKEIMLRHIVHYSNFSADDIYKTGFSKLLNYPDFNNATALASGLSLFENRNDLSQILNEACKKNDIFCWIGEDLIPLSNEYSSCSIIAIPYRINQTIAGAIAIMGPNRIHYRKLFSILKASSEYISETLTALLYKFKITFRQPTSPSIGISAKKTTFIDQSDRLFLENKGKDL